MRVLFVALSLVVAGVGPARAGKLRIFDTHMHYSHDAWQVVPPREVVEILRKAGVRRAHARWSRQWLSDLPPDVARKIAYENGDRLFGGSR